MQKRNKQQQNIISYKTINFFILSVFAFFTVWGVYTVVKWDKEFIFDRFFAASIALATFFLYRSMKLSVPTIAVGTFALVLHHLKLYQKVYLGIPFDHYMHFAGGFALALIFCEYFINSEKRPNYAKTFFLSICVASGIGSFMEIIEFTGKSILGHGQGLLFYGDGDWGEYNNTAWDMINNTIGAAAASVTMIFTAMFKKRK